MMLQRNIAFLSYDRWRLPSNRVTIIKWNHFCNFFSIWLVWVTTNGKFCYCVASGMKNGLRLKMVKMVGTLLVLERSVTLYEQLSIRFLSWYQIIKNAKSDFVNSLSFLCNLVLKSFLNISVICWFFLHSNCSLHLCFFLEVVTCECNNFFGGVPCEWHDFLEFVPCEWHVTQPFCRDVIYCVTLQDLSLAIFYFLLFTSLTVFHCACLLALRFSFRSLVC